MRELRKLILFTILSALFSASYAKNLYWVGNSGNFNDPSHWSLESGGIGGAGIPTNSDKVYFDTHSFTQASVIQIVGNAYSEEVYFSDQIQQSVSINGSSNESWFVNGSFKLFPYIHFLFDGKLVFQNEGNIQIDFSSVTESNARIELNGNGVCSLMPMALSQQSSIEVKNGKLLLHNSFLITGQLKVYDNAALEVQNSNVKIFGVTEFMTNAAVSFSNAKVFYNSSQTNASTSAKIPNGIPVLLCTVATVTNPTCFGSCDGIVVFNVAPCAGVAPFDISWTNTDATCAANLPPATTGILTTTFTVTNVCGCGTAYGVLVSDAVTGPIDLVAVSVTNPPQTQLLATATTQPLCNGSCNGQIRITLGGVQPFSVNWNNGTSSTTHNNVVGAPFARDTLKNACAGNYTLTVTDANGCVTTFTATLNQPSAIQPNGTSTSPVCNNQCTGTAQVSPTGGTGGIYTYSWTPGGATTPSISGLCAPATYTCTVRDVNNCPVTYTTSLVNPPPLSFSQSNTNLNCFDVCNGTATVSGVSGGTLPYSFTWAPGSVTSSTTATSSNATGLCAGNYTCTITDANSCPTTATFTVTSPTLLVITAAGTNPTCATASTGSISVSVSGGTPGYSCFVNGVPGACANLTNLPAGNYTIIAVDALGCNDTNLVTLSDPPALTVNMSSTNPSCFGQSNGCVTATAGGGTGAYSYTWTPAAANQATNCTFSAGAGTATICVTVGDANGCTVNSCTTITSPSQVNPNVTSTNPTCNGSCNGTATSNATGGAGGYTYSWTCSAATTASVASLCAGTCSVTVTDANGCNSTSTFTLTQPNPFSISVNATPLGCAGQCASQIASTVSGGTPVYTYTWSPGGQNTPSLANQCAGSYTVNSTDANGCTANASVTITAPPTLTITPTITNPVCFGSCNGSISVVVSGGTSPYGVVWAHNGSTNLTQNNLCAGTYSVTATDANNCSVTQTFTVTAPTQLTIAPIPNDTVSCIGNCDGSLTANVSGGTGAITYSWLPGPVAGQTNPNLCVGSYSVTATDANGCTATAVGQVMQPVLLNVTVPAVNPSCIGSCIGSATVTPSGGSPPYSATWSPVGPVGLTPNNLCIGTYTVTITDANGCTASTSFNVSNSIVINVNTSSGSVSCNGSCDATAIANVSGGSGNYSYTWLPGPLPNASTVNGLCAGSYTLNVTDNTLGGCLGSSTFTITAPPVLTTVPTQTNVSCTGSCNGAASVTAAGGTSPYSYSWSNGSLSSSINNQCAGNYTVIVTDNNGCVSTQNYTLNPISQFTITPVPTSPTTCSGTDGSICVNVSGGTPGYTFLWSNPPGGNTNCINNIASGTYTLTITDLNGCDSTINIGLSDPTGPATSHIQTNETCAGACDGSATISGVGTNPITFLWPNGSTSATQAGLCPGNYPVQVTDGVGCTMIENVLITGPTAITANPVVTNPTCSVGSLGSVLVTPSGGNPQYQFQIDGGALNGPAASFNFTNVTAGTHTITVTDASNCTATFTVNVNSPNALLANATATDVLCNGNCNGIVTANPSGGNPGYTYSWSSSTGVIGVTQTITNLCAGNYTVIVTDATNCATTGTVTINQPASLTNAVTAVPNSCGTGCTGSATSAPAGGVAPYTYNYNSIPSQNTQTATALCPGNYQVIVTDFNGCQDTSTFTITAPTSIVPALTVVNPSCNGVCDGSITSNTSGGTGPYTYSWSPAVGASATLSNVCDGTYSLTITDAAGCSISTTTVVTEPATLLANLSSVSPSCFGLCDGSLTSTPSGGTANYSFTWLPAGPAAATNPNLCAGTYTVIVNDANGCTDTTSIVLSDPPQVNVIASIAPSQCAGPCNGSITINTVTGTSPFTLNWLSNPPGGSSSTVNGLCAGTYSLQVTDNNNCSQTFTFPVSNNNGPIVDVDSTDVTCNGSCDGTAQVVSVTGNFLMSYSWNTVPADNDSLANNLCAGNYFLTTTDANTCVTITTVTINEPLPIDDQEVITDATCVGVNDGQISFSPTGGTGPFTFSLDGGAAQGPAANFTFTNVSAGSHTITILDANLCPFTATVVVGSNTAIVATVSDVDIVCNSLCNGSANLNNINGGTSPYTISWNDPTGQTGTTANNLCAGSYTATVTDNIGCISTFTTAISEPTAITITTNTTTTACGQCNATANITPIGGGGSYTYLWSNGQTTNSASGLCAGVYQVNVTDNLGCTVPFQIGISNLNGPSITTTSVNPTCNGVCDGSATITAVGGTAPYVYQWVNLGQSGTSMNNLCAGVYFVQVQDASNCIQTHTITLTQPSAIVSVPNVVNPDCNTSNGSISLTTSGGSGAGYTYSWTPNVSATSTANNLAAGVYTVVVNDGSGCSETQIFTLNNVNGPSLIVASDSTFCNGSANGTATVTVSGGTSPYTILWSNGSNGTSVSGLAVGNYAVTVTDASGCISSASVSINEPLPLAVSISNTQLPNCQASCNGSVVAIPSGGTLPYSYSWSPTVSSNASISNLCAGSYMVNITDANGCVIAQTTTLINNPNLFVPNSTIVNPTCGNCDGSITIAPSGGTSPYTYLWNTGDTGTNIDTVCAGVYQVAITDAQGCSQTLPITVSNSNAPVTTYTVTDASCNGVCNASIATTVTGGTAPIVYSWLPNGETTSTLSNQCAGTYFLQVTDSNNCTQTSQIVVGEPQPFVANAQLTSPACGVCNGQIIVNPSGGVSPYSLSWNTGSTNDTLTALCAGSYTLIATDNNGCKDTINVALNSANGPVLTLTTTDPNCNGDCNGTATVVANGGTAPINFNWSNGQTGATATNLCDGNYIVTATDAAGCIINGTATVTEPTQLVLSLSVTNQPQCSGDCNGTFNGIPSGGTMPFNYAWLPAGPNSPNLTGICSGTYTLNVTDANGCAVADTQTVNDPAVFLVNGLVTDASCNSTPDGSIDVTTSGGVPNYTWQWSGGSTATTEDLTNILVGNYTLVATDANGCDDTLQFTVNANINVNPIAGNDTVICGTGSITLNSSGSNGGVTYQWYQVGTPDVPVSPVSATPTNTVVTPSSGTTQYYLEANNSGCINRDTVSITSNNLPVANAGPDFEVIYGQSAVIGGNPTATPSNSGIVWSPPSGLSDTSIANPTANSTSTITYIVTVTDTNGCVDRDTMEFVVLPQIFIPNGFSPNGDGKNDTWVIDNIYKFPNCEVEVYNRWGELLFLSKGYTTPWDGRYKNKPVPIGTYYYVIKLNDDFFPEPYTGPLTILR